MKMREKKKDFPQLSVTQLKDQFTQIMKKVRYRLFYLSTFQSVPVGVETHSHCWCRARGEGEMLSCCQKKLLTKITLSSMHDKKLHYNRFVYISQCCAVLLCLVSLYFVNVLFFTLQRHQL